ncbi:hypothetical protein GCM10023238_12030 [Streptomyces heliomycini]
MVLLALGIVAATAGERDGDALLPAGPDRHGADPTRDSLGGSELTLRQIDSLSVLSFFRDRIDPDRNRQEDPDSLFAAVDARGEPVGVLGFEPTGAQRDLADAVGDARTWSGTRSRTTSPCAAPPTVSPPPGSRTAPTS